ncbi:hypothetical protein ACVW0Y_002057 [Pseudomonas sp. TE3786]
MNKIEGFLVVFGLVLVALATVLLVFQHALADCVDLLAGGCQEVGFAYEAGGKLALLLGFVLFLAAALHGLLKGKH